MRRLTLALALAWLLVGCGGSARHSSTTTTTTAAGRRVHAAHPAPTVLRVRSVRRLPSARSGAAAADYNGNLVIIGGLSAAGLSTPTVFMLGHTQSAASLPGAVHDAAATVTQGRLLLFGGGQFEGSDRIIQVAPGKPRQIGTLPQPLSDLEAVTISRRAYVIGGWNGSATNPYVYRVDEHGHVTTAGRLPLGLRYAAVAAIGSRIIVAGGELASGAPTANAYAFDSSTGRTAGLPRLPAPTDHAAGAVLNGTFYVIGGVRNGSLTNRILAWRPGERRWRVAGRMQRPLADAAVAEFDGGIAVAGGRDASGKLTAVSLLGSDARGG